MTIFSRIEIYTVQYNIQYDNILKAKKMDNIFTDVFASAFFFLYSIHFTIMLARSKSLKHFDCKNYHIYI